MESFHLKIFQFWFLCGLIKGKEIKEITKGAKRSKDILGIVPLAYIKQGSTQRCCQNVVWVMESMEAKFNTPTVPICPSIFPFGMSKNACPL